MSTYCQIIYQIVFGTKHRKPSIDLEHDNELYMYIGGIIRNKRCKLYIANGIEDHLHIVTDIHPSVCVSDFIKDIKISTNRWMKDSGKFTLFEGWQGGYAAFTYSIKEKEVLINYVKNQKKHHLSESFYDEYKRLLIEQGIDFDEKYLL